MNQVDLYEKIGVTNETFPGIVEGYNFNNLTISNMDLSHVVFSRCSFVNTRFDNCNMSYATFVGCNMEGSYITGSATNKTGIIVNESCSGYGIRSDHLEWLIDEREH